jgi:hypothetical protein
VHPNFQLDNVVWAETYHRSVFVEQVCPPKLVASTVDLAFPKMQLPRSSLTPHRRMHQGRHTLLTMGSLWIFGLGTLVKVYKQRSPRDQRPHLAIHPGDETARYGAPDNVLPSLLPVLDTIALKGDGIARLWLVFCRCS